MTADEFDNALLQNLRGAFQCAQAFIGRHNAGRITGVSSISPTRWNQNEADGRAHGASKGIVSHEHAGRLLSATPTTVNAVSPGWIQVDGYETLST